MKNGIWKPDPKPLKQEKKHFCKDKSCKKEFVKLNSKQPYCFECTLKRAKIKTDLKYKNDERAKDKATKEKLTNWRAELQKKIQLIARLIDKGQPCLSRGYHAKQFHGGHVFSKGSNKTIALNLHNVHRQSAQSNHFQNDDGLLREGLVKEYGQKYMDFISELRATPQLKYSNDAYHAFYLQSLLIANMLKKQDLEYSLSERIELRNRFNLELGIYDEKYCIFNFQIR